MAQAGGYCPEQNKSHCPTTTKITPTRCWASCSNGFCFRNIMPCSFDYLIYPYYPAYTMGCYQIVIRGDNGNKDKGTTQRTLVDASFHSDLLWVHFDC